jgi:hypothetical protein
MGRDRECSSGIVSQQLPSHLRPEPRLRRLEAARVREKSNDSKGRLQGRQGEPDSVDSLQIIGTFHREQIRLHTRPMAAESDPPAAVFLS